MKKNIVAAVILVLVAGVVAWRWVPIRIAVPPAQSLPRELVLTNLTSTIEVPVTVGLAQLDAYLEKELPNSAMGYHPRVSSGYVIERGDIKVRSTEDGVTVSAKVKGSGIALNFFGLNMNADFAVSLMPSIGTNWQPYLKVAVHPDVKNAKIAIPWWRVRTAA